MSTMPSAAAGEIAVIWVALLTVNDAALLLPNLTDVAPVRLVPVMVTLVPPVVGPLLGLTLVTVGAGVTWVQEPEPVPVPLGVVTTPSTAPAACAGVVAV